MRYGELLAILLSETIVGQRGGVPQRADEPSSDRSAFSPVQMHDLLELLRVKDSALRIFDLDVTNTHARPFSGKPQDIPRVRDPCCHRASRQAAHKPIRRRHGRHADKHIEGGPERDSGSGALPSDVKSRTIHSSQTAFSSASSGVFRYRRPLLSGSGSRPPAMF